MDNLFSDRAQTVLSGIAVFGMMLAAVDAFVASRFWGPIGLALVYLAGGVPASLRAVNVLWKKRVLDIASDGDRRDRGGRGERRA